MGFHRRRRGGLVDKFQNRSDALFDLIAAVRVNVEGAADRIGDVFFIKLQRVIELAEQESFLSRVGIHHHHLIDVAVRHAENEINPRHQFARQRAAPLGGNIDAQLLHRAHRVQAGRLAVDRADARRKHEIFPGSLDRVAKKPLGHWTSANVTRADEQDGLHVGDGEIGVGNPNRQRRNRRVENFFLSDA